MKKVWNFIYKYRIVIALVFLLIIGVFGFITVKQYLYPDDKLTVYGNRLDGIDKVKITDEKNMNRKGSVAKYADSGPIKDCNLYSRWLGIKNRCYNVHFKQYKDYGGRGIKVCDEWLYNFKAFYDWSIENGYSPELQIDRINNDGNYEPNNCRWVTRKVNMNNTRRNRKYANTEVNN